MVDQGRSSAVDAGQTHEQIVDACIARLNRDMTQEKLEQVFGQLIGALWLRASRTLSEVTLDAIFERALFISRERFPLLIAYQLDYKERRITRSPSERTATRHDVIDAFRHLIVTVLTLLGNLTADILLIGLYQELNTFLPVANSKNRKKYEGQQKAS